MQTINHLISDLSASDARSTLYYLSRYLKQAARFDEYGKDIFEDDNRSAPSDFVKHRTLSIVSFIEEVEGTTVAKFDDATYRQWAEHAADVESGLQPEASPLEIERAAEFMKAIENLVGKQS